MHYWLYVVVMHLYRHLSSSFGDCYLYADDDGDDDDYDAHVTNYVVVVVRPLCCWMWR